MKDRKHGLLLELTFLSQAPSSILLYEPRICHCTTDAKCMKLVSGSFAGPCSTILLSLIDDRDHMIKNEHDREY